MAQSLYESMQRRMQAVQQDEADPGNPDLYGYNQATGAPPPVAPQTPQPPQAPQTYQDATTTAVGDPPPPVTPPPAIPPVGDPPPGVPPPDVAPVVYGDPPPPATVGQTRAVTLPGSGGGGEMSAESIIAALMGQGGAGASKGGGITPMDGRSIARGEPYPGETKGTTPPPPQPPTVSSAFQDALLAKLNAPPPTAQSAEIAPAIQANRLAEQRGQERNRALLAERNASQGITGGGVNTQLMGLEQQRAAREGQFEGQAVGDLAARQAQDLIAALSIGGQRLSDQDRLALQERLGLLDAAQRQQGLNLQGELGRSDLALRGELGRGGLDVQRGDLNLRSELGRGGLDLQRDDLDLRGELGRGGLDINRGDLDLRRELGRGELDLRRDLGTGDLDVRRDLGRGQLDLGRGELDLRGELGRGGLNLGLMQAMLADRQFGQNLGAQTGMFGARLNQDALLALLGGM